MTGLYVFLGVCLFIAYTYSVVKLVLGPFPDAISDKHYILKEVVCWLMIAYSTPALIAMILLMIVFYPLVDPTRKG